MKRLFFLCLVLILSGCSRPHRPAEYIIDRAIITPNTQVKQTKVTVTRNKQFIGAGSGGMCKFVVTVDDSDIALLKQNQYITAYLNNGLHKLRVSNECTAMSFGMRKTLDVLADGTDQEYVAEVGIWGQYRLWRTW
ncbi:hypothetical protein AU510_07180 [Lonsdalea britannica]|uniref:hypothetical protein n=1 Tax=Lonsdalea britannica TaxID=1082704 RepID=UPI000A200FC0|nr:hypothetical protein [Lonsdalea britannica]OSN06696.1 hypothetical protein AU510_07180 [Lonsdalea britannica]